MFNIHSNVFYNFPLFNQILVKVFFNIHIFNELTIKYEQGIDHFSGIKSKDDNDK